MAGVKGRSGGWRPGAGRKPKPRPEGEPFAVGEYLEGQPHGGALKRARSEPVPMEATDMLQMLQDVALGRTDATALQVRAAIAAVQYTHSKKGEGGKKDAKKDAAKSASSGAFGAIQPPRLVVNNT